ncbi:MAG TPA: methyltransferase domain-containing protein [Actinomycetota bacterium]|nr:methyltransferase domain-containing protein [Actinomycetota bacterium]
MDEVTPVALFVFDRHVDLPRTIECLRADHVKRLLVFADGPRGEADVEGVERVRALIRSIDWADVTLDAADHNRGLSASIEHGLGTIFDSHERAIVVEDDVCVAPGFYAYMNACLDRYADEPRVAGVTGLRYPFDPKGFDNYPYDVFFAPRFSSWGWGTWKRFWMSRETDRNKLSEMALRRGTIYAKGGADLPETIGGYLDGTLEGAWDAGCAANILINDQLFVWPVRNMIENTGLINGTHSSARPPKWRLEFEGSSTNLRMPDEVKVDPRIMKEFLTFFEPDLSLRQTARRVAGRSKRAVLGLLKGTPRGRPDPKDYTTTDGPMEVPCQREAYLHALNQHVADGDRVLDVGHGLGYGMKLLSTKAGEVYGVDVDLKAVEYARAHVLGSDPKLKEVEHYDGYGLPYGDKTFDLVTCVDVIEHVEDYHRFIDELLRVAKRTVIFSTPNRRPEYTNRDGTPRNHWHLREWSFEELDEILHQHPVVLEWRFIDGPWEGPFTLSERVGPRTLVLLPALHPN